MGKFKFDTTRLIIVRLIIDCIMNDVPIQKRYSRMYEAVSYFDYIKAQTTIKLMVFMVFYRLHTSSNHYALYSRILNIRSISGIMHTHLIVIDPPIAHNDIRQMPIFIVWCLQAPVELIRVPLISVWCL